MDGHLLSWKRSLYNTLLETFIVYNLRPRSSLLKYCSFLAFFIAKVKFRELLCNKFFSVPLKLKDELQKDMLSSSNVANQYLKDLCIECIQRYDTKNEVPRMHFVEFLRASVEAQQLSLKVIKCQKKWRLCMLWSSQIWASR